MNILPMFCDIDDFCLLFEPLWHKRLLADGLRHRHRKFSVLIGGHDYSCALSSVRLPGSEDFLHATCPEALAGAFLSLTSYNRFVELQREALIPLWCYLQTRFGDCTGPLVCGRDHIGRLPQLVHPAASSLLGLGAAWTIFDGLV